MDPTGDCWLWIAGLDEHGYGIFSVRGKRVRAHRFAYEALVGEIPEGMHLDHLCRIRRCINPDHLEPVSSQENVRRGALAASNRARAVTQTHCKRGGHPLSGENLRITSSGRRECKACRRKVVTA